MRELDQSQFYVRFLIRRRCQGRGDFTPGNVTEFPQRVHGKIFLGLGADTYFCSGTVVESARKNVVVTAGHCLFNQPTTTWFEQIAFVPGYENKTEPYGIFAGKRWFTTQRWIDHGDHSYDIGLVVLVATSSRSFVMVSTVPFSTEMAD